jgi:hypothetical protein
MKPSDAIHVIQVNADPNHYTQYIPRAQQIAQQAGIDLNAPGNAFASASANASVDASAAVPPVDCPATPGTTSAHSPRLLHPR